MEEAMMEEASEPESQTSNFGVTRVPTGTESLIVLYKKVCFISLVCAALALWISDQKNNIAIREGIKNIFGMEIA